MALNKVSEMFSEMSDNFKGLIDANTVVGEPITAGDGTIIVPVSKVSFGFGGGGSEFDAKKSDDVRFGGGIGGGASVKPEAFLVINNDNVRLIPMDSGSAPLDKLVDLVPGLIDKVNGFIAKRSAEKTSEKTDCNSGEEYDNNQR